MVQSFIILEFIILRKFMEARLGQRMRSFMLLLEMLDIDCSCVRM